MGQEEYKLFSVFGDFEGCFQISKNVLKFCAVFFFLQEQMLSLLKMAEEYVAREAA